MFAFYFIQLGLQEAGPQLFPVALGVPYIPQGQPYSSLGRGLPPALQDTSQVAQW